MIKIEVYDKTMAWRGPVVGDNISVTEVYMKPGKGTFSVRTDSPRFADLLADGSRVKFTMPDGRTFSGRVSDMDGSGPTSRSVTFTVADDFNLFGDFLCWVLPDEPITNQGIAGTHHTITGPAETVVKGFVTSDAITRLGLPVQVATDLGRGPTITVKMRYYTVADKVFAAVDGAGLENGTLRFTVTQQDDHLLVDCYETELRTTPLSVRGGTLASWKYSTRGPTVTDVVIAGQGEGQLRLLRTVEDSALAAAHNWRWERFRDARDTDDPTTMYERGNETLAEGAPKAGISVVLRESRAFGPGSPGTRCGDRVYIEVSPGNVIGPEIVREVTWTDKSGEPFGVRTSIGDNEEEAGPLVSTVRSLVRYLRRWNP